MEFKDAIDITSVVGAYAKARLLAIEAVKVIASRIVGKQTHA